MLGQFGDLLQLRPAFFIRVCRGEIINIQHNPTADEAKTLHQVFLLVLGQFQSDCFVHTSKP